MAGRAVRPSYKRSPKFWLSLVGIAILVVLVGLFIWHRLTITRFESANRHFEVMLVNLFKVKRVTYHQVIQAGYEDDSYQSSETLNHQFTVDYELPKACQLPAVDYLAQAACFQWWLDGIISVKPKTEAATEGFKAEYRLNLVGDGASVIYKKYHHISLQALVHPDKTEAYPGLNDQAWSLLQTKWHSSDNHQLLNAPGFNQDFNTTVSAFRQLDQAIQQRLHAINRALLPTQYLGDYQTRQDLANELLSLDIYQPNCQFSNRASSVDCRLKINLGLLEAFYREQQPILGRAPQVIYRLLEHHQTIEVDLKIGLRHNLPETISFVEPTVLNSLYSGWQTVELAVFRWQFNPATKVTIPQSFLSQDDLADFKD